MKWMMTMALAGLMQLGCASAFAGEERNGSSPWLYELKVGLLAHDVGKLWSHFRREQGVDFNAEAVFSKTGWSFLGGRLRPSAGISVNSGGDTSKAYAGGLVEWKLEHEFFVTLGLGVAVHDGELRTRERDKKELGSRILFRIPAEFGVAIHDRHRISIMFDHVSNGYLSDPNEGLDTIGVRYGYLF